MKDKEMNEYLGDGVYASFDGYYIWLAANHSDNKVIAIEPDIFEKLIQYRIKINEESEKNTKNNNKK
jgi:hypothetical protein